MQPERSMNRILFVALITLIGPMVASAQEPPPAPPPAPVVIPRTHVDSTVVGDAMPDTPNGTTAAASLDTQHDFHAGAPDIIAVTKRLDLSPSQQTRLHDVIESADAGAAALIRRENAVTDMIAATNPQDPMYSKLTAEHSAAPSLWKDNRDKLRRDVLEILTPIQRARFEKLSPVEQ